MIKKIKIRTRNCENCCYSKFVLKVGDGEYLYCDLNPYVPEEVSLNHCCNNHIFMDEDYGKDISDIRKRFYIKSPRKLKDLK